MKNYFKDWSQSSDLVKATITSVSDNSLIKYIYLFHKHQKDAAYVRIMQALHPLMGVPCYSFSCVVNINWLKRIQPKNDYKHSN